MAFEIIESVEWTELKYGVPTQSIWPRCTELPKKGEKRVVLIPKNSDPEHPLLYQPGYSSLNGWSEAPNEISESAIVSGKNEYLKEHDDYHEWYELLVEKVIQLPKITSIFRAEKAKLFDLSFHGNKFFTETIDWLLFEVEAEGDFGRWALFQKKK